MNRLIVILLFTLSLNAQNKQLLYGFSEIPQATTINPATTSEGKWYMGIPLLSHIHAGFGMSGLSAYDLFADNDVSFSEKVGIVVKSMKHTDMFGVNQQLEVFSGGFALQKGLEQNDYVTFGMYQETDFIMYYPKDIADLAYEGNANNLNRAFNLGHLNVQAELLTALHVGYSKKIDKQLQIGVRGKLYSSVFNVKSTKNVGTFTTRENTRTQDEDSFYTHIFDLDMEMQSSGVFDLLNDENGDVSNDVGVLTKRFLFGGNLGLGVDFGFTKQIDDQTMIEGSIQDFGFIRHTKDVENYKLDNYYELTGITPKFEGLPTDGSSGEDYWQQLSDEFDELIKLDTNRRSYTSWRPLKLNAAWRYKFNGKNGGVPCKCKGGSIAYKNEVGAQLFAIKRPLKPQVALTGYYYKRFGNAFRAKTTYTIDSYSFSNVGLGMSAHFFGVNFYLMADNLIRLTNLAKTQSQSVQLGFNYIFTPKDD